MSCSNLADMASQFETAQFGSFTKPQHKPPDLEKLLHSIADVVCSIDEYGVFQYVSPASFQLLGYFPEEMMGVSFLQFIHPEDISKTQNIFSGPKHASTNSRFTNRFFHQDGSMVSIMWSARWDAVDRLLYCVARNGKENEVLDRRLTKAQEMAKVASFEFDVVANSYTYVSDTLYEIFGLDPYEFPRFTPEIFWSLVHPDDTDKVRDAATKPENLYASTMEYRILRRDGQVVYIKRLREVIRDAAGQPVRTIGTIQDITEQKSAAISLQRNEERFRSLVQNGNELLGIIDQEGNYQYVGANIKEQLGWNAAQLNDKNLLEFIHPHDAVVVVSALREIKYKKTVLLGPFRFKSGCGSWRWMETTASNHLDNPAIMGITINSRDVTDRKTKDDELLLSEQRFKTLVHNGSDLIVIIDRQVCFAYISDNVTNILGYATQELIGRSAFDFIHEKEAAEVKAELEKVYVHDDAAKGVQHRFLHKNGHWIWLESKGTNHVDNTSVQGVLVNARVIDDRVKLQKRLNQELVNKQKEILAAIIKTQETERTQIGLELHDNVNQVLATVKLYNEMYLSGYMQGRELLVKAMQLTQECINEIRSISKRLSAPTLGKISLLDSLIDLVDSINLTKRVCIELKAVGMDQLKVSEDLHLAVYRIVQEGMNNMLKYAGAKNATIELKISDQELQLLLLDDGSGFDLAGKSNGIGITNMRTRAENLNASFHIESQPGSGCRIVVCFPVSAQS